jgi:hypothetical protein
MRGPAYADSVFVNAPFDDEFLPLLHAILFTIHDAGFVARLAVEKIGGSELRLPKILRLIKESRLSIHDLSRVHSKNAAGLPRFNMPFECGLALGAMSVERPRKNVEPRDYLVLVAEPFQDQKTASDLAGQDSKAHHDEPQKAISAVRHFLRNKAATERPMRGATAIHKRFEQCKAALPVEALANGIGADEISTFDYITEWLQGVVRWQRANNS